MGFKLKIKIWWLKRRAKELYLHYHAIGDAYGCGNKLLQHISPTAAGIAVKFDRIIAELYRLDPTCPIPKPLMVR